MDGRALAAKIREQVAADVAALGAVGLVTVLVGDDPASDTYIRLKHKAALEAGIHATDLRYPATMSEAELLAKIAELNADDSVDALLVQLPLPDHIDEDRILRAVDPAKDVDGFHPVNAGELYLGRPGLVPATAEEYWRCSPSTRSRSRAPGPWLSDAARSWGSRRRCCSCRRTRRSRSAIRAPATSATTRATPTSRGRRRAGRVVTAEMVKPGSAVIDVGMNRIESGLVGDVDPAVPRSPGTSRRCRVASGR